MKVESINQTLRAMDATPTAVRVEGSFLILSTGFRDVYYNDYGREVFSIHRDPSAPMTFWQRIVAAFHLIFSKEQ